MAQSRLERVALIAIPVVAGLALLILALQGRKVIDADLHLVVPRAAQPGAPLPLRARVFTDLEDMNGPSVEPTEIDVVLRRGAGEVARTELTPTRVMTSADREGKLEAPTEPGRYTIEAIAPEYEAHVVATLEVSGSAGGQPLSERPTTALNHYTLFPIAPTGVGSPPSAMELRVLGGACVPEKTCTALVWVGAPGARVAIEPSGAVEPKSQPSSATAGLAELTFVVHGPEADIVLLAHDAAGAVAARRTVRLPVVLGIEALSAEAIADHASLQVEALGGDVVVDAFRDGDRWEHTGSLAPDNADVAMSPPFELAPGTWRLQIRTDPFAPADSAATRFVRVLAPGETPIAAARAIASEHRDAFAAAYLRGEIEAAPEDVAAFVFALRELELASLPEPARSYAVDDPALREEGRTSRIAGVVVLLVAGLLLVMLLARRGFAAVAEARRLMQQAGRELDRKARLREAWTVVGLCVMIAMIFVALAILVWVRGVLS